jgi:hypothetical protein
LLDRPHRQHKRGEQRTVNSTNATSGMSLLSLFHCSDLNATHLQAVDTPTAKLAPGMSSRTIELATQPLEYMPRSPTDRIGSEVLGASPGWWSSRDFYVYRQLFTPSSYPAALAPRVHSRSRATGCRIGSLAWLLASGRLTLPYERRADIP